MKIRIRIQSLAIAVVLLATGAGVQAGQVNWNVASGNFTNGANWAGASFPASGDQASIQNGGSADMDGTPLNAVSELWIGNGSGATGVLNQSAGTLSVNNYVVVGRNGTSTGTYHFAGGSVIKTGGGQTIVGDINGAVGTVNMSGSSLYDACVGEIWISTSLGGHGTWNLSGGTVICSNWTCVGRAGNDGTLNISGGYWSNMAQHVTIGSGTSSRGRITVSGSGTLFSQNNLYIGETGTGAVTQTGGTIQIGAGASVDCFNIGRGAGSYGYFHSTGGILSFNEVGVAASGGGNGFLDVDGGTFTPNIWFTIARGANQTAIINVSAGSMNAPGGSANAMTMNWGANDTSVLTISGSGSVDAANGNTGRALNLNAVASAGNLGAINLNGGTLTVNSFAANGTGTSKINFNGGTLKAAAGTANAGTFLQGLTSANVYSGGAIIDDNGQSITINQALLATSGYGVSGVALTSGGAGYIGPPLVTLSGGSGSGARAIGQISPAGALTNILIACPGTGYLAGDTITATLSVGGYTNAGTLGIVTMVTNNPGGLTKIGAGTLTLGGANTFSGNTRITAGTLTLNNVSALAGSTLDLKGADTGNLCFGTLAAATLGGLTGSRDLGLTNASGAAATCSIGNNNLSTVYDGHLYGIGGLTKIGSGTLTMTATNSYTGVTTVNAGKLVFTNAPALTNAGNVWIGQAAGLTGTLELSSNAFINSTTWVNISDGGGNGVMNLKDAATFINPGQDFNVGDASTGTGTLNIQDNATLKPGQFYVGKNNTVKGIVNLSGNGSIILAGAGTAVQIGCSNGASGTVNQANGTFNTGSRELWLSTVNGGIGTYTISGGTLTIGNWLCVGRGGNSGHLYVNGGLVNCTANNITIGSGAGNIGTVTVGGGTLQAANSLFVGESGNGTLLVNTGTVTVTTLSIAQSANATGQATISGGVVSSGSGGTIVGNALNSTGVLTLTGGTNTTTAAVRIGGDAGAGVGTVTQSMASVFNCSGTYFSVGTAGTGAYTLNGGTLTLTSGASGFNIGDRVGSRGTMTVNGGVMNVPTLYVGKTSALGTMTIQGSPTVTATLLLIGSSGTATGAVIQSGGTFTVTGFDNRIGGSGGAGDVNAYGYYNLSGGTLNVNNNCQIGAYGQGVYEQSGGTANMSVWLVIGRFGGGTGVVAISGGTFNQVSSAQQLIVGEQGTGVLNVNGSAVLNLAGGLRMTMNYGGSPGVATVNLNGGTLTTPIVWDNGGTSRLSFNGGTLKANAASATFLTGLDNAFVYSGGAIINDGGFAITINQNLLPPTGSGVTTIPVNTGGSGYVGPPMVLISGGGGNGATASAQISGGVVTGIQITNPGNDYTSEPTVTLVGGGPSVAATLGTTTYGANTAGGLTKTGKGTLTLSGANTYSGGTHVNMGTLLISGASALPSTGTATINRGGNLSVADGTIRSTTAGGLTLAGGCVITLDWNGGSVDTLTTAAGATAAGNVGLTLNLATPSGNNLTLLHAASGLSGAGYFLANNTNYTATLTATDTDVKIGSYASGTALTAAYWYGAQVTGAGNVMSYSDGVNGNWSTIAGGLGATALVPGSAANVYFSATGASQQNNILPGANMTFNSLTFNDATPVTIAADGFTFTLLSTATGAGSAISVNQNATINANLILGVSQTWTVAAGKTLTAGGEISGSQNLTKASAGTLILTGTNTWSGTFSISNGVVQVGAGGTTGTLGTGAVTNNSTLVFNRSDAAYTNVASIAGPGTVTKSGSGTVAFTGTNTYGGATMVSNGVMRLCHANCLSTNTTVYISSGGSCDLAFTGTNTIYALYINGRQQEAGVHGSTDLPAGLSGTGYLNIRIGPPEGSMFKFF